MLSRMYKDIRQAPCSTVQKQCKTKGGVAEDFKQLYIPNTVHAPHFPHGIQTKKTCNYDKDTKTHQTYKDKRKQVN